jgi:hypothetical protein
VALVGSWYTLDHVLEISYPSIAALGSQVKRKDVDALESVSLYAFVGIPNDWDSISFTAALSKDLEKHEEWMQGNVKSGFNAMQYAGSEFPLLMVRKIQVRLPEGKDILGEEESEVVQYAYSLRKLLVVEVSSCDKFWVEGVLNDFKLRGKLRLYSLDCDLLPLNVTSRNTPAVRMDWYKTLISQMNYQHVHTEVYFEGVMLCNYPARGEMDPCYHDGRRAFKNTSIRRELMDIRRPDGQRVFLGAIDGSGENAGRMMPYYYNDDKNEAFVNGMCNNLPMYLHAYLRHVKGYSLRSIAAILSGCSESYRLSAPDSRFNLEDRSIVPLAQMNRSDFAGKMAARNMQFLLPEVMSTYSKQPQSKKQFSDAAKEAVAKGLRFKNKAGFNPTPADTASVLSNNSHTTTGAASNRSVTTQDIQCRLPELRSELNRLRQRLLEVSCDDKLFGHPLMTSTSVDELSLNSSASAQLAAFYKDTEQCILLLKVRLGELGVDGSPLPASGSTGPSPSSDEGSRGAVQGA